MRVETYKDLVKQLRNIAGDLLSLSNEFRLSDADIRRPLARLEIIEEELTSEFIYGK